MQAIIWISESLPLEGVSPKGGLLQVPNSGMGKGQDASAAWWGGAGAKFQAWILQPRLRTAGVNLWSPV